MLLSSTHRIDMEPENLEIFGYLHPSGKQVFADPLVITRRLTRMLGQDVKAAIAATKSEEDTQAEMAFAKLARAVCTAFDLGQPFDQMTGLGVREAVWVPVLNEYTAWLEKKNLRHASTPTSQPSTASKPCGCHTPNDLPSGSTYQGNYSGRLTPQDEATRRQLLAKVSGATGPTP
jgi:hypothetical protein